MLLSPKHQGYYDSLMLHLLPPRRWQLRLINHSRGLLFPPSLKLQTFKRQTASQKSRSLPLSLSLSLSTNFTHFPSSSIVALDLLIVFVFQDRRGDPCIGEEIVDNAGRSVEREREREERRERRRRRKERISRRMSFGIGPRKAEAERRGRGREKVQVIYESCTVME